MSVTFIRNDFVRKIVSGACLFAFPLAAQQANTSLSLQAAPAQGSGQQSAPVPNGPQPKSLPEPTHVDYSRPAPILPNPFARYIPRQVPPPSFTNGPKLEQMIQNGKLFLSLNDAVAIALADNLDIAIFRYNLPIADTDILLTKAGGSPRGVNSGVVSNTPGGGVGGIGGATGAGAGGTTAGAGGAGAGAGGIVGSTSGAGPAPEQFDPILTGNFNFEHATFPVSNTITTGAAVIQQNSTTANFNYLQGFSPGTDMTVTYDNQRIASTSRFNILNPTLSSSLRLQLRQHLLQGFGRSLNMRLIVQAKNNKKITEEGFRDQVISTVSQIEGIYWDLVNAYEDMKVKERSLGLAQKTLSDNQKQVEIGTLAPLDVVRAQSTVATAEQDLIVSRTNLQLQQLIIKNALTRNLPSESQIMQVDVVPTDFVEIPEQENLPPVQDLIKQALDNRPDYAKLRINLQNSEINIKGAKNGLLPQLDLIGFYGGSSLAGPNNPLNPTICGNPAADPATCTPAPATTGFGNAFNNLFNSSAPDKGVAFSLVIPIRNRAAQATQVRSMLEYRQSQLNLKQIENQIAINVRNDAFTLQQNRARVAASQKARDLAAQTLDAEQKKYNLGASTYLAVLQDERDLAAAESALVTAMTNYAKSRVQLDKDTAQTLERNNIKLNEAATGQITTQPNIPGIVPNKTALQENAPSQRPQPQQPPPQ
jgi:outer membrane protein